MKPKYVIVDAVTGYYVGTTWNDCLLTQYRPALMTEKQASRRLGNIAKAAYHSCTMFHRLPYRELSNGRRPKPLIKRQGQVGRESTNGSFIYNSPRDNIAKLDV